MKKIWTILKDHIREDFSWPYYLSVAAFLGTGIILNHYYRIEARIDRSLEQPIRILFYFLLYGGAYYGGAILMALFRKQTSVLKDWSFWLLSLSGLLIFAFDSGFPFVGRIMLWLNVDISIQTWTYSVIANGISLGVIGIPLFLVYQLFPVARPNHFGLDLKRYDFNPYLTLLLIVSPLIVVASFVPEFTDYYPTYKANAIAQLFHLPKWIPIAIYELVYATDFFNVELFARGFLVIGLSQLLGKNAIVPMVTIYCFMHFGKPVGEQISSIVGGYILGVIAFYTRGIWGGVIIHIGIAWMMELTAYLQKLPGS